jgi:hypothetical protein
MLGKERAVGVAGARRGDGELVEEEGRGEMCRGWCLVINGLRVGWW